MARSGTWKERDCGRIVGRQNTAALIKFPDKDPVQAQINVQNETTGGIRLNHVRVCAVVSTESEASGRSIGGFSGSYGAGVLFDIGGGAQMAVGQDWQHGHRAAKVVGDQHELSGRMKADVSGASPAGRDGVEQGQLAAGAVDGEGADGAFVAFADAVGFICRIETSAGGV